MISKQESVRRHSLYDQFAEPLEQAFFGGFSVVLRRHNHHTVIAEVKGKFGQVDRFGQTWGAGPGQELESAQLLAVHAHGAHQGLAFLGGKRRSFPGRAEKQCAVAASRGKELQVGRQGFKVKAGRGLER